MTGCGAKAPATDQQSPPPNEPASTPDTTEQGAAKPEATPDPSKTPPPAAPPAVKLASLITGKGKLAQRSSRCGECHERIFEEWSAATKSGSGHANAWENPVFQAALRRAPEPASCTSCHAPLAVFDQREELVAEGVNCESCHRIEGLTVKDGKHVPTWDWESNRRYGNICDAKDHYFHKVSCKPVYAEGSYCAQCHALQVPGADGRPIDFYATYAGWKQEDVGMECQECHMVGEPGEVAVGERTHPSVAGHAFLGIKRAFRSRSMALKATVTPDAPVLEVDLTNANAGHPLPAGSPVRTLVLDVRLMAPGASPTVMAVESFGRRLVAADGSPAFSPHDAVRVESDTRIKVEAHVKRRFDLPPAPAEGTRVEVRVRLHQVREDIARLLGVEGRIDPVARQALVFKGGAWTSEAPKAPDAPSPAMKPAG